MAQKFKVGDKVEIVKATYACTEQQLGKTGKVYSVHPDVVEVRVEGDITFSHRPEGLKLVEKPAKVRSQEILLHEVQAGDELVCFINYGGVELRKKGVAHSKSPSGQWHTEGGANLTYFATPVNCAARHIYLLSRPEPKKPEIAAGFYWVTEEGHHASPWKVTVANEKAEWETNEGRHVYGTYENLVAVKSGKYEMGTPVTKFHTEEPVKTLEDGIYTVQWRDSSDGWSTYYWVFKGGKAYEHSSLETARRKADNGGWEVSEHWVKQTVAGDSRLTVPVPYVESKPELTDLEKFEQAGLIGTRYRDSCNKHLQWKVTAKGNIKGKHLNVAGDVWEKVSFGFDTLQKYVAEGILVKI